VSTLGSQISLVAFPLLVLTTTHWAAKAGLVGFANEVPVLVFICRPSCSPTAVTGA
jgi:hypothetical protein